MILLRKRILKLLSIFLISMFIVSCEGEDKMFKFEASLVNDTNVYVNQPFLVLVKTTNISSSDFNYQGSSTVIGATIYLKSKDGLIINPEDVPTTNDFKQITIPAGSVIERVWSFNNQSINEPGWYDLFVTFYGQTEIIEDFIYIE